METSAISAALPHCGKIEPPIASAQHSGIPPRAEWPQRNDFQTSVFLRGLCGENNGVDSRALGINHRGHGEAQRNAFQNASVQILISGAFLPSQERPCGALAAEGVADLGEVGGRVADEKDGGDRVGGLGLDVEGHAGGGGCSTTSRMAWFVGSSC